MSSLYLFLLCCFGSLIIHLWFYSDFFAYYAKAFKKLFPSKIYKSLLIDDYFFYDSSQEHYNSYIEFIFVKKYQTESFFTKFLLKLFSCITCFTVWISIIIAIIIGNLLYIGVVFIILRLLDFILRYTLQKRL
jgi:hypothetical protein